MQNARGVWSEDARPIVVYEIQEPGVLDPSQLNGGLGGP